MQTFVLQNETRLAKKEPISTVFPSAIGSNIQGAVFRCWGEEQAFWPAVDFTLVTAFHFAAAQ